MKKQQSTFYEAVSFAIAAITAIFLIFLAALSAQGQTVTTPSASDGGGSSVRGISFPVAELGGCASKDECKNYCNQSVNMDACIAFAKDHGIMTKKDADRAEKFTKQVREGSGPGSCDSPQSCDVYCSNISHLDECTTFAEKNGFKDEHYEQGKKIQSFLKKGGTTPGNCQSKQECETYCGDFSHAKECFDFAQKAGIMQKGDSSMRGKEGHEPNAEQLSKLAELSQKGETPGHCASKAECEKYCSDGSHNEECVNFGVKIGFIQPDEAEKIKQTGGKGPGGCNSQESCHAYCNDQSHHEECFKFAEEHGFITKEESEQAKEGWVRARQGFENAPPEVRECLKTTLGANILDDIQTGKLVPGPDIGDQVRGCFEKFGGHGNPQEAMKNIPPEAAACLKEKFGDTFEGVRTGKIQMTPEMADSFRVCFQMMRMNEGFTNEGDGQKGQQGEGYDERTPQMGIAGEMERMLRSAPPEIVACVKEKFPEGFGNLPASDNKAGMAMEIKDKIRGCFENFRPVHPIEKPTSELQGGGMNSGPVGQTVQDMLRSVPPEVAACVKEKFPEGISLTSPIGTEIKDKIRGCFENFHPAQNGVKPTPIPMHAEGVSVPTAKDGEQPLMPTGQNSLANMPPEVMKCLQESLGAVGFEKLQSAPASPELVGAVKTCIEKTMRTMFEQNRGESAGYQMPPSGDGNNMPYPPKQEILPSYQGQPASTGEPVTFLEKFIGAALLPLRWILGK
jgi:hypothetical protein